MKNSNTETVKGGNRYLKSFFVTSFCFFCAVLLVNGAINPFGLLTVPVVQGINSVKPRMLPNARMIKAHQITAIKPAGLILGSSRAETGINPEHPGWSEAAKPVYNSSLPSGRIFELYQYLRHAHSQNPLKQVVLGLDYFSFDLDRTREPGYDSARLNGGTEGFPEFIRVKDLISVLFSFNALDASADTLFHQNKAAHGYLSNGSQDTRNRRELVLAKGGHHAAFKATLKAAILSEDGITKTNYTLTSPDKPTLKYFRDLLKFCRKKQIELYILISPVHAQWLEMIWQLGAWDRYEQWKRDVVWCVNEVTTVKKPKSVIELWDFSGFHTIAQEPVPAASKRKSDMKWYWEANHYKREVGDLMLDRVLVGIKGESPNKFGVRLDSANIDSHLKAIRDQRNAYVAVRPEEKIYIGKLIHLFAE